MNSSRAFVPGAPRPWWAGGGAETTVVLPLLLAGVCLVGLAGNALLLVALAHELRQGKGSPANALLLNLCAADLSLVLCCIPPRVATYSRQSWLFGDFLCRATDWLLHGCLVAKSLTWAAVGQACLSHVLSPSGCLHWSRRRLAGILASVWTAALLLPLPLLLFTRWEAGAPAPLSCAFQTPPDASSSLDVFSKVYPLAAYLVPAAFAWACYGRALRLQKQRKNRVAQPSRPSKQVAARPLFRLSLLFQAMWLPAWVAWLWERHRRPLGGSPPPPPALLCTAEVLVFLNSACNPGVVAATSTELRDALRSAWAGLSCRGAGGGARGARAGEPPRSSRDPGGREAAEKALPDVEHFWKDRRNAAAGEENDPVPWEHQCDLGPEGGKGGAGGRGGVGGGGGGSSQLSSGSSPFCVVNP